MNEIKGQIHSIKVQYKCPKTEKFIITKCKNFIGVTGCYDHKKHEEYVEVECYVLCPYCNEKHTIIVEP